MCGRYSLTSPPEAMVRLFGLDAAPNWPARYNIAPTQMAPVVLASGGGRRATTMRWGLVPSWAKDISIGARMINARAETVAEKPSFRAAFRKRRCLVPADGFYEWTGKKGAKQPYSIRPADGVPFAFAGLWEAWRPANDEPVESFTIVTTEAGPSIAAIHHRMPVVVPAGAFDAWLDAASTPEALHEVIAQASETEFVATAVSRHVNDVRNDDPACIEPMAEQPGPEEPEQEDRLL